MEPEATEHPPSVAVWHMLLPANPVTGRWIVPSIRRMASMSNRRPMDCRAMTNYAIHVRHPVHFWPQLICRCRPIVALSETAVAQLDQMLEIYGKRNFNRL